MRKIETENLTEKDKGYLVGLFLGDGYAMHSRKDRHYNTEFYLNSIRDSDIQQYLVFLLEKANIVPQIAKDPRYNVNRIRASSKLFFQFLQKELAEFESNGVTQTGLPFLLGFISGLIDSEGWVAHGTILITQKDDELVRQIELACEKLDIHCTSKQRDNTSNNKIWRVYVSTSFKYLTHVSRKVGRAYSLPSIASRNAYKGREVWSSRWAHNP